MAAISPELIAEADADVIFVSMYRDPEASRRRRPSRS